MTDDKMANAFSQAKAQLDSIKEMVEALQKAREAEDDSATETAERAIHEDALSVEVRPGWYVPGDKEASAATHYRILLCTGGPAVQITGELSEHGEPETAHLEAQDWFLPWTEYRDARESEEAMLEYARCFYFGE
jgi:hypothetical protein